MEIERDVTIERERDLESAYSTFLSAASEMPNFSEEELAEGLDEEWRARMARLFEGVEA